MKNINFKLINMNKATKIALLGCGAFLLVNSINNTSKNNKTSKKLDTIIFNQEIISLKTNELKIDSLQLEIMDLGARLDSCIISK